MPFHVVIASPYVPHGFCVVIVAMMLHIKCQPLVCHFIAHLQGPYSKQLSSPRSPRLSHIGTQEVVEGMGQEPSLCEMWSLLESIKGIVFIYFNREAFI